MANQMFKRTGPGSAMGFSMGGVIAALLISAGSVHPQTTTPSTAESGSAMQSGTQSSGTQSSGTQSSGTQSSGTQSSGTQSSGTPSSGTQSSGKSGASSGTASATAGKSLSTSDRNMMQQLANANMSEIALGKLALTKTTDKNVHDYAQHMIDDHGKALEQVQALAQEKGVQLPTAPDAKHQALGKKLNALSGHEFDRQYLQQAGMYEHQQVHSLLERIHTHAQSPELKTLAANMLPTVNQHAQLAQHMHHSKVGQTSSGHQTSTGQ